MEIIFQNEDNCVTFGTMKMFRILNGLISDKVLGSKFPVGVCRYFAAARLSRVPHSHVLWLLLVLQKVMKGFILYMD